MTAGHVLVAPDKFRGSLSAARVADHVARGLRRVRPRTPVVGMPVADGGDGTVDAAVASGFHRVERRVTGPTGEDVVASFAVRDAVAVVELAQASGLALLPSGRPAPLTASSFGTGELIAAALRRLRRTRFGLLRGAAAPVCRIVLGLGGSASTDGGTGMMQALGARFLDAEGKELPSGGAALNDLASVDLSGFVRPEGVEFVVAGDVDNPLLGPEGAAAVYAPQKGAAREDVAVLETGLARLAEIVERMPGESGSDEDRIGGRPEAGSSGTGVGGVYAGRVADRPGAGAAGGVGFAAMAFLDATMRPGADLLLDLLGFAEKAVGARLVVTGEGSLDAQTLRGKAPAGVARAAARAGVPVVAVCGGRSLTDDELTRAGIQAAYALTDLEPDPLRRIREAGPLLEHLAERVALDWLSP
ncbi:glycerate kinase [Rhizohabitans arisaemae]|uniref:glycerate kinase n=1 Tax=Rhizohabitans arisaemae TaxID=2720610 RepID=UPI0024B181E3|nr:glycerate kinase [Rhizohabitans arisaemae]